MPEVAGFEDEILGVGSLTRNISGDRGVYPVRHHTNGGRCRLAATRCGVVNVQPHEKLITPPHELEVLK